MYLGPERSLDTVVRAVSAVVLPVLVGFTSLQGLPCAPGPATTCHARAHDPNAGKYP